MAEPTVPPPSRRSTEIALLHVHISRTHLGQDETKNMHGTRPSLPNLDHSRITTFHVGLELASRGRALPSSWRGTWEGNRGGNGSGDPRSTRARLES